MPASRFKVFELKASLDRAAPRPLDARRTAATRLGRPVSVATTNRPTTMSGTPHRPPSRTASFTITIDVATMTASIGRIDRPSAADMVRPVEASASPSRSAASSSCSSERSAAASQRAGVGGSGRRATVRGLSDDTTRRGSNSAARTRPVPNGPSTPDAWAPTASVAASATPPFRRRLARPMATRPTRSALTPSRNATLNTLEPKITPRPRSCWPLTSAVTADAISGASAPSAVISPTRPGGKRNRSPTWSSRSASTALDMTLSSRLPPNRPSARTVDRATNMDP